MSERQVNIVLVEDEFINRRQIKKALISLGYNVFGEAMSVDDALDIFKKEKEEVDLAIIDINLGEKERDGIWLGKHIRENFQFPFIYLTAYGTSEIIKRAVSTIPEAYLTKPFNPSDLLASIEIALQKQSEKGRIESKSLVVKSDGHFVKLPISDIDYIESRGNYLMMYSAGNEYKYRSTIKRMLKQLDEDAFIQVHRSFIVNKRKIDKMSKTSVIVGTHEIPVSSNFKDFLPLK